jgi:hypothetical protein
MSYNGSGTFLINTAGQPVVSGTVISSTAFNALTADLATGLSTAITKDGQTTITANIPMANYKFTGLGVGSGAADSANLSQVQSTAVKLLASVSGADTITAVGAPTVAAYAAGQMFYFVAAGANTGAVTINIDSLGAKNITRDGTTALAAGDIQSGEVCVIVYDGTQFQLVNGASQSASIVTENLTVNKATVLNESGGDNDTRIEGDTDANLFFVDASTDRIGVGTDSPAAKLHVSGQSRVADSSNAANYMTFGVGANAPFGNASISTTTAGLSIVAEGAGNMTFLNNGSEAMRIDTANNLGLGVTPSAWTNTRAFDIGLFGAVSCDTATSGVLSLSYNAYAEGASTWKYKGAGVSGLYQVTDSHKWYTAASGTAGDPISFTQAMTLDASGNLGVGTTSPAHRLQVETASATGNIVGYFRQGSGAVAAILSTTDLVGFGNGATSGETRIYADGASGLVTFSTNSTERCRVTAGGDLLVGQTANSLSAVGHILDADGVAYHITDGSGVTPLYINRRFNDGNLVEFYQADALEGSISVSGSTVSYNGGHLSRWSQTTDNTRIELLKGTVMSNLDQMAVWEKDGEPLPNEQLNCMKVSDVEGDPNVAGVFVNWDNDDDVFTNDMNVAMTGDMIIRIAQGVTVQRGDLLMSAGDGTAKPQGDDIIRSKTIAKVTSTHVTCTYEDGSYCVPCVLMAC